MWRGAHGWIAKRLQGSLVVFTLFTGIVDDVAAETRAAAGGTLVNAFLEIESSTRRAPPAVLNTANRHRATRRAAKKHQPVPQKVPDIPTATNQSNKSDHPDVLQRGIVSAASETSQVQPVNQTPKEFEHSDIISVRTVIESLSCIIGTILIVLHRHQVRTILTAGIEGISGLISAVKQNNSGGWPESNDKPLNDLATTYASMAKLRQAQGRYTEAENLYDCALRCCENALSADHPDIATLLEHKAGLYQEQHRYDDADVLLARALPIREKALARGPRQ